MKVLKVLVEGTHTMYWNHFVLSQVIIIMVMKRENAWVENCMLSKMLWLQTTNVIACFVNAKYVVVSDFKNQSSYSMKAWTGTKLLLGINGNMFLRRIQSPRKMKRNILIKLDTQVLQPNCLYFLWGHCTIIWFIYSTFDGKPCSLKNVKATYC